MKLAHKYDPTTKLFVEDVIVQPDAQADPSAKETYTLPADCTFIQPIGFHTPKWDGKAWVEAGDPTVIADLKSQVEFNNSPLAKVQQERANNLPSIGEQLDMQYWDTVNGTTVWKDMIAANKLKFPK